MTILKLKSSTRVFILIIGAALIGACANTEVTETTPTNATLQRIPPSSSIRIVGIAPSVGTPDVTTPGESVARATGSGAAGGALYGAGGGFYAGLGCGPLFIVCSPVGAVFGAAVGAVVGAAAMGVRAATLAIPAEKAEALEAIMTNMMTDFGDSRPLVQAFETQSAGRWLVTDREPATEINLSVEQLYVDQGTNDMLVLKMVSSMVVTYEPSLLSNGSAPDTTKRVLFTYTSPEQHVDYWIADDGASFLAAINEGYMRQIATMIDALDRGISTRQRRVIKVR